MTKHPEVENLLAENLELKEEIRRWERKHADLAKDLGFFRAIVEQTRLPAYLKDADGKYLMVNREFERLAGVSLDQLRGKTDFDVFPEPVARLFQHQDQAVIAAGKNLPFDETIPLPDGIHSFITEKFPLLDGRGKICGVGGVCTDITQHKEMERELADEKDLLDVTLRSLADGVITTDRDGCVLLMNRVASELTGWSEEESHGQPLENVFSLQREHDEPPVKMDWKSTGALLVSRDGNRRPISLTVAPMPDKANQGIGHVLVFRDVTDQRRMEQELLKTRKLESLQVIAGGIAHDFNNFLTAVLGNISLASALTRDTVGKAHQLLTQAEQATLLARNLTQQLLTFAKGGEPVKTLASLSEVLQDSAGFLLRGSQVRCEFDMAADLWPVEVDTGLMSQVIQNLILNASDAMSGTGVIRIRCQNVHLEAGMHPALPPGSYVLLAITDPGSGILPEIQEKIFDPFFSTKPGGTGLGLAITHSIITRHGGHIGVQSRPGGGSTFAIHLPASIANVVSPPECPRAGTGENTATRGKKLARSVLIMDDDPLLRTTLESLLEFLGYDVVPSADGQEAIHLYRTHHQQGFPFDLVIMDLTIPGGMGGREAVKILRDIEPTVQVIVSSGFSDDPIMSRFAEYGFSGVLTKPYRLEDLEKLLSRIPWPATPRSPMIEAIPAAVSGTPSKHPPDPSRRGAPSLAPAVGRPAGDSPPRGDPS